MAAGVLPKAHRALGVEFGFAKLQKQKRQGCAAMDGGWLPSVVLRFAQHHAENPHGCGFSAAQAIVVEILFAEQKDWNG
jgi:hypothetical protein